MKIKPSFYIFSLKKIILAFLFLFILILIIIKLYPLFNARCLGVQQGVILFDQDLGGLSREEVLGLVEKLAVRVRMEAENAVLDLSHNRIIPEVNGLELDAEATVDRIMKSPSGTKVQPVYRQVRPQSRWDEYSAMPAYQGNPKKNSVSFMINVAWGEEYLDEMLSVLESEGVKATFFITGRWAEKNPAWVKKIYDAGHEMASHGYSDSEVITALPLEEIERSILFTNELLFEICGTEIYYFTPHKGEYNRMVLEVVSRYSMRTVMWSLDTVDWSKPGVEKMEKKILDNVKSGDIILMHPTEDTPVLLSRIIPVIKERGFYLVTVGKHLSPAPFY